MLLLVKPRIVCRFENGEVLKKNCSGSNKGVGHHWEIFYCNQQNALSATEINRNGPRGENRVMLLFICHYSSQYIFFSTINPVEGCMPAFLIELYCAYCHLSIYLLDAYNHIRREALLITMPFTGQSNWCVCRGCYIRAAWVWLDNLCYELEAK